MDILPDEEGHESEDLLSIVSPPRSAVKRVGLGEENGEESYEIAKLSEESTLL